jgi:hypothetical protein
MPTGGPAPCPALHCHKPSHATSLHTPIFLLFRPVGTQRFVHLRCLRQWQDSVQKRNAADGEATRRRPGAAGTGAEAAPSSCQCVAGCCDRRWAPCLARGLSNLQTESPPRPSPTRRACVPLQRVPLLLHDPSPQPAVRGPRDAPAAWHGRHRLHRPAGPRHVKCALGVGGCGCGWVAAL